VLENGLEAWKSAGFPTLPVDSAAPPDRSDGDPERADASGPDSGNFHTHVFLPGLVENYANRHALPIKRELAVLFVDIADSTPAILGVSPEEALRLVQRFMGIVTDAALTYCGDVKDYEGDGALLSRPPRPRSRFATHSAESLRARSSRFARGSASMSVRS